MQRTVLGLGGGGATLSNTKQMANTLQRSEGSEQVTAFHLAAALGLVAAVGEAIRMKRRQEKSSTFFFF